MLERLVILGILIVLVVLAVVVVRAWTRARAGRLTRGSPEPLWRQLGTTPDGRQTVIAFSTPACAACHTAQRPALELLEQQLGVQSVRVIHVDAARQPEVARVFGVLTVPSTVVLAQSGYVAAVNQGFTPAPRLAAQLATTH